MDQLNSRLKQITNELKQYFEARIDLLVLNIGENITGWLGSSIQKLIGFVVLGVGGLFGLIALAIWLGDVIGNEAMGYLVVAFPLMLIGALLAFAKPGKIAHGIQNQFMDGILKSIEKEENNQEQLPPVKSLEITKGHEQENRQNRS
ncbi:MAG: phage holin family protein [Balneolaceae bacterium]|nr:phage holin family protein [Balneolaceae bacterium]